MADFSNNIINRRFREVYRMLEEKRMIRGKSDIAQQLGTYNHVINSILKAKRNITVDQLHRLFETYDLNANFMFGLSDEMFSEEAEAVSDFPTLGSENITLGGRSNITLVPERARAGYATEHQQDEYLDRLPTFSIPGMDGQMVAFEINGDSMMPTITNGDLVICEPIERDEPMYDNQVYVIVTDVVVAKRIQQIREDNHLTQLRLLSDNYTVYQPYEVDVEEIRQILRVKCRLTNHGIQ